MRRNEDSGYRQGFLGAAVDLQRDERLPISDHDKLAAMGRWFDEHLPRPDRFTRKRNASHKKTLGLSWFKDSAHEHLRVAREMIEILGHHGVVIQAIETERPGYIVYEDDYQIVAEPFSDTGA